MNIHIETEWMYYYLISINLITFSAFAADKRAALKHKRRIRNAVLLGLSFFGGSVGGLIAMYIFRHKTRKKYYTLTLPLFVLLQLAALIYFMRTDL